MTELVLSSDAIKLSNEGIIKQADCKLTSGCCVKMQVQEDHDNEPGEEKHSPDGALELK